MTARKMSIGVVALVAIFIYATVPYDASVVAKTSLTAQTDSIATTTVYTPTNDHDVAVTVSLILETSSASDTTVGGTIYWSDAYGPRQASVVIARGGIGNPNVGINTLTFHVAGGSSIQVSTTYTGNTSLTPYDMYVTVVKE